MAVLLAGTSARACSVPVFRYALENWQSDPYPVVFFYRGELTPEQDTLLGQLSGGESAGKLAAKLAANVEVHPVNLDDVEADDPQNDADLALWKEQNTETLPWMVVKYPLALRKTKTIWAGKPTEESVSRLLDSPKRREVAKRLLNGDTAVWLFLESGYQEKDDKAYERLQSELRRSELELELPAPDPQDIADGLISVDQASLEIRFSIVRLSRDDPKEQRLIDMLLDSEADLRSEDFQGQPMTFPVFGRGRALYAVIGGGINREVIFDVCRFLTGPCSCQVKNQNPGTDLLMAVNWEQGVTPTIAVDTSQPPLPVIEPVSPGEDEADPKTTAKAEAQSADGSASASPKNENKQKQPRDEDTSAVTAKAAEETSRFAGSRVISTTLICLVTAIAGITVVSVFLLKS